MHRTRLFILSLAMAMATLLGPQASTAQLQSGAWHIVVTETSNTCGDPLGPLEAVDVTLLQSGNLVDIDVPDPNLTEVSGVVSGSSIAVGFEVFDTPGLEIYDPAQNVLTIAPGNELFSGSTSWEYYEPLDCAGTQTWTAQKQTTGTPGDLSGDWDLTVVEVSETCGPIDPTPIEVPITLVQEGTLVDGSSPVDFGQTRIVGRVIGSTLNLGLGIRELEGDFTVYDAAENSLAISGGFDSFSGTMTWRSYEELVCTGVSEFVVAIPEPGMAISTLIGAATLLTVARRRARSRRRVPFDESFDEK